MSFEFIPQKIKDVILIKPQVFNDNRGFFLESYKQSEFIANGIDTQFVQDNYSKSTAKVLRGLHFQKAPYEQAKLVRCTKGRIYDFVVDIRPQSSTFKQHLKIELSEENKNILYIPEGFAHGFVVLSEEAEISYKTSKEYNKDADCGIYWADETLAIDLGIDFEPILSEKDKNLPKLEEIILWNYSSLEAVGL